MSESVFITGATGYMGARLARRLADRGHRVRALVRPGSEKRVPPGCDPVIGNALDSRTYAEAVHGCTVFIQLVGVAHPNPLKADAFRRIDGASGLGAVAAARQAGVSNFIYVSVAQPAPIMRSYVAVRAGVEDAIREAGLASTILRPWYVLGPGHWWPAIALPILWIFERLPIVGPTVAKFGFVTIDQMVNALERATETRPAGVRVWDVAAIRRGGEDE